VLSQLLTPTFSLLNKHMEETSLSMNRVANELQKLQVHRSNENIGTSSSSRRNEPVEEQRAGETNETMHSSRSSKRRTAESLRNFSAFMDDGDDEDETGTSPFAYAVKRRPTRSRGIRHHPLIQNEAKVSLDSYWV
jgi:hypothetical protein